MLTLEDLKEMQPDSIFTRGITTINDPWHYGKTAMVKWIAIRGGIHDWAIYHSFDGNFIGENLLNVPDQEIANMGAKLHDMDKVQELVPANKEAIAMYRH